MLVEGTKMLESQISVSSFLLELGLIFDNRLWLSGGRLSWRPICSHRRRNRSLNIFLNRNLFFNSIILNELSFFKEGKAIFIKLDLNLNTKVSFFRFARSDGEV